MVTLHELTARAQRTLLTGVCNARRYRKFAGYRHVPLANELKLHQFYRARRGGRQTPVGSLRKAASKREVVTDYAIKA
jgi:hypothetical protein